MMQKLTTAYSNGDIKQIDPTIEQNSSKFKHIFAVHSTGDKMSIQELLKFCKKIGIIPDLATIMEIKQLCIRPYNIKKTQIKSETIPIISFIDFEELIQQIALFTIKRNDGIAEKIHKFLELIKIPIKHNYKQNLITKIKERSDKDTSKSCYDPKGFFVNPELTKQNSFSKSTKLSKDEKVDIDKKDLVDTNINLALKVLNMPKVEITSARTSRLLEKSLDPQKSIVPKFCFALNGKKEFRILKD